MPIDMSLLKDFRCVLTVPKGGLVRQQQKDGSWLVVQSPERLRVLYRRSVANRVSVEAGMLTCKVLASSAAKGGPDAQNRYSRTRCLLVELLLLRLTSCLILVRLLTSCPSRLQSRRVSR
jgi:hypothetical protein